MRSSIGSRAYAWGCQKPFSMRRFSINWGTKPSSVFNAIYNTHTPSNLLVAKIVQFNPIWGSLLLLLEALMEGENPWIFGGVYISFIWLLHFLHPYNTNFNSRSYHCSWKLAFDARDFFYSFHYKKDASKIGFHKETN